MADALIPAPKTPSGSGESGRWPNNLVRSNEFRHHMPGPGSQRREPGWSLAQARLKTPLSLLFAKVGQPALDLTDADYDDAAAELGVEVEAIKAVAQVETAGDAFEARGRPRILFERHHFHRHTSGQFDASNPIISNSQRGGYGQFSEQYEKLEEAYALDQEAALKSASWGRFQIMGSNHRAAGFATVTQFVTALTQSESAHLRAFVSFVKSNAGMLDALQKKDWAGFARRYNGPAYYVKGYDKRMEKAYDALVTQRAPKAQESR
jgi:hypothetical protein